MNYGPPRPLTTARYREQREAVLREHHAKYDRLRDRRVHLKSFAPRSQLQDEDLAFVESEMKKHRLAGLQPVEAAIAELEKQRRAEVEALDRILKFKFADIDVRVRRGLLEDRMSWDAGQQKFVTQEPANAA
jgi:hypothetical protein